MDTMGSRLRQARIDAKFASARAAALRFGWSPSTYAAHENGQNKFGADAAADYARAFATSPTWLLLGVNRSQVSILPVTALIFSPDNVQTIDPMMGNGRKWSFQNESKWTYYFAECEFFSPKHSVAFEIKGHGMWPRYENGDLLISDYISFKEDWNGKEHLALTGDGISRLRIAINRGGDIYDLQAHNAPPLVGVEAQYLWKIDCVIKAGNWTAINEGDPKWAAMKAYREDDADAPRLKFE